MAPGGSGKKRARSEASSAALPTESSDLNAALMDPACLLIGSAGAAAQGGQDASSEHASGSPFSLHRMGFGRPGVAGRTPSRLTFENHHYQPLTVNSKQRHRRQSGVGGSDPNPYLPW